VQWQVIFHPGFEAELPGLGAQVQRDMAVALQMLAQRGPTLPRPWCDTLAGSRHANMKELRFRSGGSPWRIAFAFDLARRAALLVGGSKGGISQALFYRRLVATADGRFADHLVRTGSGQGNKP
jgi:hypothetical protein